VTWLGCGRDDRWFALHVPQCSEATVKGYVSRTLDKLGLENRTQAGLLAHDAGLAGQ
jgi:DNA-binding NarL/FixJ family response regulator